MVLGKPVTRGRGEAGDRPRVISVQRGLVLPAAGQRRGQDSGAHRAGARAGPSIARQLLCMTPDGGQHQPPPRPQPRGQGELDKGVCLPIPRSEVRETSRGPPLRLRILLSLAEFCRRRRGVGRGTLASGTVSNRYRQSQSSRERLLNVIF